MIAALVQFMVTLVFVFGIVISLVSSKDVRFNVRVTREWKIINEPGRFKRGWVFNETAGSYEVCDSKDLGPNTNNFLVSPTIQETESLNFIQVEIHYSVKYCHKDNCSSAFKVGVVDNTGQKISHGYFLNANSTIETLQFDDLPERPIQLGIRERGGCGVISKVIIIGYFCEKRIKFLAIFPKLNARSPGFLKPPTLQCVPHSSKTRNIHNARCGFSGTWNDRVFQDTSDYPCECSIGYEPVHSYTECQECIGNTFKSVRGNQQCKPCPVNSQADDQHSKCSCLRGYFAAGLKKVCVKAPKAPSNIQIKTSSTSARFQWKRTSSRSEFQIFYVVVCQECPIGHEHTILANSSSTDFHVDNLKPDFPYTVRVYSVMKNIDLQSASYSTFKFITKPRIDIRNVHVEHQSSSSIILQWSPSSSGNHDYIIRLYKKRVSSHFLKFQTNKTSYQFTDLLPNTYVFQVAALGESNEFSTPYYVNLNKSTAFSSHGFYKIIPLVAFIFILFVCFVSLLLITLCCYKNKNVPLQAGWYETERNMFEFKPTQFSHGFNPAFVEPYLLESEEKILMSFTKEIDKSRIVYDFISIKGNFGNKIERGYLKIGLEDQVSVGLKIWHEQNSSSVSSQQFAISAGICGQFNHPNVIMLHGIVNQSPKCMMQVLEYADKGTLDQCLRENQNNFNVLQLVHMARGIACGMEFFAEEGYVHKVLTSSNVLVSKNMVCKIAGFDDRAALDFNKSIVYSDKLVGFMSPEVLSEQQFSWTSDSWSFGVILWQMLSFGEPPYLNMRADDIIMKLNSGYRLPPSMVCPVIIYDVISMCWHSDYRQRLVSCDIRTQLEQIIRNPANLADCSDNTTSRDFRLFLREPIPHELSLSEWLTRLNLVEYEKAFIAAGIHTISDVSQLSVEELKVIGMTNNKHRKRILKSLQRFSDSKMAANIA